MTGSNSAADLEEGTALQLDFTKVAKAAEQSPDVIPVAVQDADSKEVILVAYVNEEALQRTIRTRIATFWSTSRRELWIKGETSGNHFEMVEVRVNCEQNSLLYVVRPKGDGICHTKNSQGMARDCYYRRLDLESGILENLNP
ncbi:MAG: phosphoribosyl-AMP cyclohydrolase [Gemmatimonadetes bacterium]|jgi:phosphoribosyl-AMP cyclohydrolase|nr:phosphoribosyl-AMP cyclohydrolase [Gemmatimonadota bacterium]MBT4613444.1 phosphoribosyl-AMP cyclohydrolase [Gemmatimonadota bacterium]MBT5055516.1 phosphoribosyl-AMP cyclohydrolase [Gemmatimonadota bacterium]MBT5145761.1 phosphoribosyl-AMP cyclohydrolase [Gemmatimonadota bacterium]MBT5588009.1 phosphoribosyl-AMP cyclohydrolase [Gemmatimonadota bacterium]